MHFISLAPANQQNPCFLPFVPSAVSLAGPALALGAREKHRAAAQGKSEDGHFWETDSKAARGMRKQWC